MIVDDKQWVFRSANARKGRRKKERKRERERDMLLHSCCIDARGFSARMHLLSAKLYLLRVSSCDFSPPSPCPPGTRDRRSASLGGCDRGKIRTRSSLWSLAAILERTFLLESFSSWTSLGLCNAPAQCALILIPLCTHTSMWLYYLAISLSSPK